MSWYMEAIVFLSIGYFGSMAYRIWKKLIVNQFDINGLKNDINELTKCVERYSQELLIGQTDIMQTLGNSHTATSNQILNLHESVDQFKQQSIDRAVLVQQNDALTLYALKKLCTHFRCEEENETDVADKP